MKLPVLLAAAALAICLTGCSHAQTDATPSATSETAEAAATAAPAATPATSAEPVCAEVGTILPETADAGRSYVDETLFIGDSNTARYLLYANETGTAFTSLNNNIGVVSMGVGSITSLKCEKFKGSSAMYTVPDAVAMLKPKRIIICYGTNNPSGSSTDATNYIKTYLQGLQAIQTAWPYCDIIVSAIPPLDRQRENTNLTMTQVDAYNAALVQMCEENGFKFLNSAEVLRDAAVGENLQDHLQIRCAYRVEGAKTLNQMTRHWWGKAMIAAQYALFRNGPMSMAPSQLGAFARSSPDVATPDLEYHVQPLSLEAFGGALHDFPAITASVCNLNPTSRGSVTIKNADFRTAPAITPNYLSTPEDRKVAADSLRVTRRIVAQPALAKYRPEEWKPGVQYQTDEDLARLAGDIATTIFHPVGTTKMGHDQDPMAVLDSQMRVRGIQGLRVVDAGAMPTITSGNTNSPTLMMAERAAQWMVEAQRAGG